MSWRLEYNPYIWPLILTMAFLAVLAIHAWRRRPVPGAFPFVSLMVCGIVWTLGSALEVTSGDQASKIVWQKFQSVCQIPAALIGLWFALEYADLRGWLLRRNFILAGIPQVRWLVFALTNDARHMLWSGLSTEGPVRLVYNTAGWILIG